MSLRRMDSIMALKKAARAKTDWLTTAPSAKLLCVDWPEDTYGPRHNGTNSSPVDAFLWTAKMLGLAQTKGDEVIITRSELLEQIIGVLRLNWRSAGQQRLAEDRDKILHIYEDSQDTVGGAPLPVEDLWSTLAESLSFTKITVRAIDGCDCQTLTGQDMTWGALDGDRSKYVFHTNGDHSLAWFLADLGGLEAKLSNGNTQCRNCGEPYRRDWQIQNAPPRLLSIIHPEGHRLPDVAEQMRVSFRSVRTADFRIQYRIKSLVLRKSDRYVSVLQTYEDDGSVSYFSYDSMENSGKAKEIGLLETRRIIDDCNDEKKAEVPVLVILERCSDDYGFTDRVGLDDDDEDVESD